MYTYVYIYIRAYTHTHTYIYRDVYTSYTYANIYTHIFYIYINRIHIYTYNIYYVRGPTADQRAPAAPRAHTRRGPSHEDHDLIVNGEVIMGHCESEQQKRGGAKCAVGWFTRYCKWVGRLRGALSVESK